ncbi:MAG: DUF1292 domain-containing protein [Bacilli bacterium]|nr:DUF1292 domain-containing protein [Bacilli bacterium]
MDTQKDDNFISVTDDEGKKFRAEILDIFQVDGYNDNNYVVYTFGEAVDDKNSRVYISKIVESGDSGEFSFAGIDDAKEWEAVNNAFNKTLDAGGATK